MIHVDRAAVPTPEVYASERTEAERNRLRELIRDYWKHGASEREGFIGKALQYAASGRLQGLSVLGGDFTHDLWKEAMEVLLDLFHSKCSKCETRLDAETGSVTFHRPRGNTRALDGSVSPLHYFWLAYEWDNTFLSCRHCARAKGHRFPLAGSRVSIGETDPVKLAEEAPLLLNPCVDSPQLHLNLNPEGLLLPRDKRGEVTIEVLNLNRRELVAARHEAWGQTSEAVRGALMEEHSRPGSLLRCLHEVLDASRPYLLAHSCAALAVLAEEDPNHLLGERIRYLLRHALPPLMASPPVPRPVPAPEDLTHTLGPPPPSPPAAQAAAKPKTGFLDGLLHWVFGGAKTDAKPEPGFEHPSSSTLEPETKQSYSIEATDQESAKAYYRTAKRIEHFTIRNFKAIEEIDLPFPAPDTDRESWLMLLGENGCGKSSILQALALTLMGQEHANQLGLDARRFVRRHPGVNSGEVVVDVSGVGPIRLEFSLDSPQFRVNPPDPTVLLLGYGATRLLPKAARRESSERRSVRILNLFDPTAPLADTEAWLLDRAQVSGERLDIFASDLSRLLMLPEDARICRASGQIEIEYRGRSKALRDMSDGFQSIVALAGDIAIGVQDWWGTLREAEGIVLLDEIEVHLHPTWKISIVERLRQTCPMLSFVVTTHDPLCLKGLSPEEIVVLRQTPERQVEIVTDIPRIDHLRSDELLASFLFGLPSTRGSGTAVAIARYSSLLGKEMRSASEEEELHRLRQTLHGELSSAITPMQRQIEEKVLASISANSLNVEDSPERLEVLRQLHALLPPEERGLV